MLPPPTDLKGPRLQNGLSGGFLAPVLDTTVYDEVVDVTGVLAYATTVSTPLFSDVPAPSIDDLAALLG